MNISSKLIKDKAFNLGFDKVGISKAESTPLEKTRLFYWISENKNGSMAWIENRKRERSDIFEYFIN